MALTKCEVTTAIHQGLPNQPTETPSELKILFDKASTDIKAYINDTLTDEVDTALGLKADSTDVPLTTTVLTLTNTTSYTPTADYHPSTKKYVDDTAIAGIGTNSLTESYMANDMKKQTGGVYPYNSGTTLETNLNMVRKAKTSGGTANAQTVDTDGTFDLTIEGNRLAFKPSLSNTGAMTLAVDGQTAKAIKKFDVDADDYIDVEDGDILKNTPCEVYMDVANDFFVLAPNSGARPLTQYIQITVSAGNNEGTVALGTTVDFDRSTIILLGVEEDVSVSGGEVCLGISADGATAKAYRYETTSEITVNALVVQYGKGVIKRKISGYNAAVYDVSVSPSTNVSRTIINYSAAVTGSETFYNRSKEYVTLASDGSEINFRTVGSGDRRYGYDLLEFY